MDLRALSHTLCVRRTSHPFRTSLSAKDIVELRVKLKSILQGELFNPTAPASSLSVPVRILGIFTGQGAQWSGMARVLMQSPAAAQIIDSLEHSLATLQDPPSWSLKVSPNSWTSDEIGLRWLQTLFIPLKIIRMKWKYRLSALDT